MACLALKCKVRYQTLVLTVDSVCAVGYLDGIRWQDATGLDIYGADDNMITLKE